MAENIKNDPSKLRIKIPRNENMECSDKKISAMQARAPPGWEVRKDRTTGECYYYNLLTGQSETYIEQIQNLNQLKCVGSSCSIQGGSLKSRSNRKKKSKTTKRRK